MITGVVLASGSSTRMGAPKALIDVGGVPFVDRVIRALSLGGCERVVVVAGGPHAIPIAGAVDAIAARATTGLKIDVVENDDPSAGPISSVRAFWNSTLGRESHWAILHPVDIPGVEPADVQVVASAIHQNSDAAAIRLRVDGRGAHPVAISESLRSRIDSAESLRHVLREVDDQVVEVEHTGSLLLLDIDTPEDLKRFRDRWSGL